MGLYDGGNIYSSAEEAENVEKWWELEEWYIKYNGQLIPTAAGELAALHVDICEIQADVKDFEKSKKRQHRVHVRNSKQTLLFLNWVFKYCERNEIGTTSFYALLATDNIEEDENGI